MAQSDIVVALPTSSRWDFGGHPYGLESLTLPMAASDLADIGNGSDAWRRDALEACLQGLDALSRAQDPLKLETAPDPFEQVFWFRWITGHQTAFVLWQLMTRIMAELPNEPDVAAVRLESCRIFVRGYSAMLLYTGSCPRSIYHEMIRPSMARQHPGFSGSWSRDFWPLRSLLGTHALGKPSSSPLSRECALAGIIHQGVASKLVPDGSSLLQTAARQKVSWRRPRLAALYDSYFLTLRASVTHRALVGQLMRRLHAIARDIAANGLYPWYACSTDEKPPSLRIPEVTECEQAIAGTLLAIANRVAGTEPHALDVS